MFVFVILAKKKKDFFLLDPNDCKKFKVRVGVGVVFFFQLFFCLNKSALARTAFNKYRDQMIIPFTAEKIDHIRAQAEKGLTLK